MMQSDPGSAISGMLYRLTNAWYRQRRAEDRDAMNYLRRQEALRRRQQRRVSLKDAVLAVLEAAIAEASDQGAIVFPKRNLYYSVRRRIQEHTDKALTKGNFQTIVTAWERDHGPVPNMYCDPRGYFIEPHTENLIPLGTREVEAYEIPPWSYHIILYVEKKGMHGILKRAQLAEKYDMGIMCAEGYSSEAGKLLLARAEQTGRMTIACLHDADPWGYNICRKLRRLERQGRNIEVIDLGLSLQDALDLELVPEFFVRDRALPSGLELTDLEREYFEGERDGYRLRRGKQVLLWRCRRVELNDLASNPRRFIDYVERKLQELGLARKLVPPGKVVLKTAQELRSQILREQAHEALSEHLDLDDLATAIAKDLAKKFPVKSLPELLLEWAAQLKPQPWKDQLRSMIVERVEERKDEVDEEAKGRIRGACTELLHP